MNLPKNFESHKVHFTLSVNYRGTNYKAGYFLCKNYNIFEIVSLFYFDKDLYCINVKVTFEYESKILSFVVRNDSYKNSGTRDENNIYFCICISKQELPLIPFEAHSLNNMKILRSRNLIDLSCRN